MISARPEAQSPPSAASGPVPGHSPREDAFPAKPLAPYGRAISGAAVEPLLRSQFLFDDGAQNHFPQLRLLELQGGLGNRL